MCTPDKPPNINYTAQAIVWWPMRVGSRNRIHPMIWVRLSGEWAKPFDVSKISGTILCWDIAEQFLGCLVRYCKDYSHLRHACVCAKLRSMTAIPFSLSWLIWLSSRVAKCTCVYMYICLLPSREVYGCRRAAFVCATCSVLFDVVLQVPSTGGIQYSFSWLI